MPASSLQQPYRKFIKEAEQTSRGLHICLSGLAEAKRQGEIDLVPIRLQGEMSVIRLHDSWARFCREIILTSAYAQPYTASGTIVPLASNIFTQHEAISLLTNNGRRYEPKWHDANKCDLAAQTLGITNRTTILNALSSTNSPIKEVTAVRNFFAHRWKGTALKVKNQSFYRSTMTLEVESLLEQVVRPDTIRFDSWVTDFRIVAEAAIQ